MNFHMYLKSDQVYYSTESALKKDVFLRRMNETISKTAIQTIQLEAQSIAGLVNLLIHDFEDAVKAIYHSKGRLVISGVGKSAIVAQKIVATLKQHGTPMLYLCMLQMPFMEIWE